jgi:pyruvate formate lyase activating enzyme
MGATLAENLHLKHSPSTELRGLVFDLRKYSVHDGPGIRTTVFLKGCPLNCWWCHNPESQSHKSEMTLRAARCIGCSACVEVCPTGALTIDQGRFSFNEADCNWCGLCADSCPADAREVLGRWMSVEQVMAEIERDVPFYDESGGGVTLSGGEPLMQPDFTRVVLRACRQRELHTALDTAGYANWETLDSIRPYVNLFLFDLKLVDDDLHRKYTGVSNRLILDNLRRLRESGARVILRTPVVPGVTDGAVNLRGIAEIAQRLDIERVDILPYHHSAAAKYERLQRSYALPDVRPPSDERMQQLAALFEPFQIPVKIGG